jgi:L-alanine-DL-glutamate epimerase-like enolase superfamily enzyme
VLRNGMVQAPTAPGLGMRLQDAVRTRPDAVVRDSVRPS